MNKRDILITGSDGLLGSNLCYHFHNNYSVTGADISCLLKMNNVKCQKIDLRNREEIEGFLSNYSPSIIIHCAASVNLDWCEENPAEALYLHRDVTSLLRTTLPEAYFIYISTDAFYSESNGPHSESETVYPLSVYAKTKLEGEKVLESFSDNSLIIRTCIYGINYQDKLSLAEWMLKKLSSNEKISGFSDTYFSPVLVNDLAEIIEMMIGRKLTGVYNVGSHDYCSKYDFALKIAKLWGFSEELVESGLSSDHDFKAQRPLKPILDVSKIERELDRTMPTVDDGLFIFKKLIDNNYQLRLRGEIQ